MVDFWKMGVAVGYASELLHVLVHEIADFVDHDVATFDMKPSRSGTVPH